MMFTGDNSDEELLLLIAQGDNKALQCLLKRHENTVAATANGMIGPGQDAEDIGQEALIRLYRAIVKGEFRGQAQVKTYVTRITVNLCIDYMRRKKRRSFLWQALSFSKKEQEQEPELSALADDGAPLDTVLANRQLVHRGLSKLDSNVRSVVVLRLINGYSTQETADILEIPLGTVLSQLDRGKKQLAGYVSAAASTTAFNS
ncbi:sigma-70 family RNA polymerase sigma factor [Thalassomonas viridans]|uniref:Sigma-70 family RNA polymerase sigma factor n=1 Tax=Thalassomonas viridans TaxID=137584 RepID=A0AAE9Z092_9GAMM|nr:sigma-70 family RNA polymerase sigma factor [Thalassomonas viridans]WDE04436.1 sigma-70 family RNA polymerase sigma factor [Thalassomonas viridans]